MRFKKPILTSILPCVIMSRGEVIKLKISTKGRYALRFLVDLAEHHDEGFVALKDIADRQHISKKYLEQIIAILNQTDFLLSNRGAQGGYKLAKTPDHYSVGNILRCTEGSLASVACLESKVNTCERKDSCATLYIWEGLDKVIDEYLDSISLQDIIDHSHKHTPCDYCI
jgi:Rrf2 family protein